MRFYEIECVCGSNMIPSRELPSVAELILEVKTSLVNVIRKYPMIIVIDIVKKLCNEYAQKEVWLGTYLKMVPGLRRSSREAME